MRRAVILILALSFCAGCGGSKSSTPAAETSASPSGSTTTAAKEPDQDPADFLKDVANENFLGQYGRVWDSLHPFHQAVVSRARYVDCQSQSDLGDYTLDKIEVVDQYDEPVRIPGQASDVPSKAVTFRITIGGGGLDKPQTFNQTAHAIAVNGEWRWVMSPKDYRAFKAHRCPPSE